MIRNFALSTLFIAFAGFAQAQNVVHFNGQNFEEYRLPGKGQNLMFDRSGALWIGTVSGAVRFDGYTHQTYKDNVLDTMGFKGQYVSVIFEDQAGGMWVGSDHGINYKAPGTHDFLHYHLNVNRILSIAEDHESTIWITSPRTLIKVDKGKLSDTTIHSYNQPHGIGLNKLLVTRDNTILSGGNGLYEIRTVKDSVSYHTLVEDVLIHDLIEDSNSTILATSGFGYFNYRSGGAALYHSLSSKEAYGAQIGIDYSGNIWWGSNQGVLRIESDKNYNPVNVKTFAFGNTKDIIRDSSGNLFFALEESILELSWKYSQYQFISLPSDFRNSYAFNFVEDDNKLWIGTFDGLLLYDFEQRRFDVYKGDANNVWTIPHSSVYGIKKDSRNLIWVATGNGVVKYDPALKTFQRVPVTGLAHHIFEDGEGSIWFVSEQRLHKVDPVNGQAKCIDSVQQAQLRVDQIYIDQENVLWAWDPQKGLRDYTIQEGRLTPRGDFILSESAVAARVMQEDDLGRLWITFINGVFVIDKQSHAVIRFLNSSNSPLLQDDAFGMVRDQSGNMWLKQHPYGSICLDPKTFEVKSYSPNWLYTGVFGQMARQPACIIAAGSDGKLFSDGLGDFYMFYPDSLRINKIPPSMILNQLSVNNQVREHDQPFSATENSITLAFSAIHFDNPARNSYTYFLEGYDKQWSAPGLIREARYSNLPAGSFNFYAKGANSDGVWSEPKLLASFTILPVWWQTNLAYGLYILIAGFLVTAFYRIKLSQRLAQAEAKKMREIDDFKNHFFTNITHEFRTPLTVITGMAEKIEGQQGVLIKRNAEQLLSLINQILELSKVEANAAKLNPEPVDIVQHTRYLLQSFSSLASEKALLLDFISDTDHLKTRVDKTKFTLIVQNLVTNAVKFTPERGTITVTLHSNENQFQIEVRDSGVGIHTDDLPFIFDRFYQADNQQENFKGTGIGLALTKELVGLMGGHIDVESKKGTGSVFRVKLPIVQVLRNETQPKQEDKQSPSELPDEKITILLIEDHEDVAAVIQGILAENFEVVYAANGREGIAKAIENIPDIIISDVMMPELNGLEATQALKSDMRTSHIPIILLTAKADIDSRLSGLSQGADIYLAKPFHSQELMLHVQNLLRLRDTLRLRYAGDESLPKESPNPEDTFVSKLQDILFEHLSDDTFGIDELCREMGISRTQLHRKLKALTGKSASLYLRDLRLAEGRKRLLQNHSTVAEVAYAVGFSDPNYFTRLYSEKYGHSPSREQKNS